MYPKLLSPMFSGMLHSKKRTSIMMVLLVATLITDTMINTVADSLSHQLSSLWGLALFIVIAVIYGTGQYFILEFVKHKTKEIRTRALYIRFMHRIVTVIQYALFAILVSVIFEIVLTSHYYTMSLVAATVISMTLNVFLMGLFAQRFLSWYNSNKGSLVILLYGISSVTFAVTSATAVVMDSYHLIQQQRQVTPQSQVSFPTFDPGTAMYIPHQIYHYFDLISFVLVWGGTVILLRHYSETLGRSKFWIVVALPLVYYLSTLIDFFKLYAPSTDLQYFYFYLYLSMNSTAGGILFGLAFITAAKTIRNDSIVRDYMTIAAYGIVLLFISDQVTLTDSGYPPFGIATISFMGLSAYLILVGLYSSAISISQDAKLRQSIRRSAIDQSKFLDGIGWAQMQKEIETKVMLIAKENSSLMTEESGIQPAMTDEEIKTYLQQVIKEVKMDPGGNA